MVKLLPIVLAALLALPAHAKLVEEVVSMPVTVKDSYGKSVSHNVVVTLFREDTVKPPYLAAVIGHGRSGEASRRASMGRYRPEPAVKLLAPLGFIVAVPTRIGYGATEGPDIEYSGPCNNRNYPPVFAAAADQLEAALALLRQRPDVSRDRGIVIGQSVGGATAIALAARNPRGVQVVLNFAGGAGGDPVRTPQQPCATVNMKRAFAGYGSTARIPTLWLYTENDMYFGPRYPREWFEAFRDAGGVGEFVLYPPHGSDGHLLFNASPETWRPKVIDFLRANGFPELKDRK